MILAIRRAPQFSPNSVEKDAAILESVCRRLVNEGYKVTTVGEDSWQGEVRESVACCLTMGRLPQTLSRVERMEAEGTVMLNTAAGVRLCCNRRLLTETLKANGVAVPPERGEWGYWLKRGDGVAETSDDVRFAPDEKSMKLVRAEMEARGMCDIVVSAHVVGDLVKFYGVRESGFFRTFYPGDDGQSKFGDELRNGKPHHYAYQAEALHGMAETAARLVGTDIYGGDCIIRPDGTFCIIDFNDWPSFSRCREEASQAIAYIVGERLRQGNALTEKAHTLKS